MAKRLCLVFPMAVNHFQGREELLMFLILAVGEVDSRTNACLSHTTHICFSQEQVRWWLANFADQITVCGSDANIDKVESLLVNLPKSSNKKILAFGELAGEILADVVKMLASFMAQVTASIATSQNHSPTQQSSDGSSDELLDPSKAN